MLTNKELIEQLKKLPENKCVFFSDICGNYLYGIYGVNYVEANDGNYIEIYGDDYDI